jgi:hypothetical protein
MTNVAVDQNSGHAGLTNYGSATITDSHINGTFTELTGPGAGIENEGTLMIDRGLIAGNQGPGLVTPKLATFPDCPTTTLVNVTITGNAGGGIGAYCGPTTLTHATVAGNKLVPPLIGAGILVYPAASVALRNSIVTGNSMGNQCFGSVNATASLLCDNSCQGFPTSDNLVGLDPKLGGLSYQGGDSVTRLVRIGANRVKPLLKGSPAIDAAAAAYCIPYDQLANPRPVDGNGDNVAKCDMGAFEYRPPKTVTEG